MEDVTKPQQQQQQRNEEQPVPKAELQEVEITAVLPVDLPAEYQLGEEEKSPVKPQSDNSSPPLEESDDGEEYFVIKTAKQWDPKPAWLRETEKSLSDFTTKFEQLKTERKLLDQGLQEFNENQRLWAHRARELPTFNKQEYFKKLKEDQEKHSLLEQLHPSILLLIFGFCHEDIYLQVLRMKRVCSSFRQLAAEEIIYRYCLEYYLGENYVHLRIRQTAVLISQNKQLQQELAVSCRSYSDCKQAFLYYKSLQYSREIAQNSFRIDITKALRFVNDINELVLKQQRFEVEYFNLLNDFLLRNQAVIALTNLSIAGVQILRSAAVKALTNHMAFNSKLSKMFVSKAELHQAVRETEDPRVRLPLAVNTRLQEALRENHYQLTLFAHDVEQTYMELLKERCDVLWLSNEGVQNSQVLPRAKFEKHVEHPNVMIIDSSYLSISLDGSQKPLQCRVSHRQHQHFLFGEVYCCLTPKGIERCLVFTSSGYVLILRFVD